MLLGSPMKNGRMQCIYGNNILYSLSSIFNYKLLEINDPEIKQSLTTVHHVRLLCSFFKHRVSHGRKAADVIWHCCFPKGKFVSVLNELSTTPWRRMEEWRYSSTILDLGTRWKWVVSFTTRSLYPRGKSPLYRLNMRLGGPRSRSGCCGVEKMFLPLAGIEPWPFSSSLPRPRCLLLSRISWIRQLRSWNPSTCI
jgi:hypothetical protein